MKNSWIEGEDFYFNEQGYIVLTAKYHLERGHCCGNGCKHCPYDYMNVPEPKRTELIASSTAQNTGSSKLSKVLYLLSHEK